MIFFFLPFISLVIRYTRLKASGTAAADEDEDQEEIELSIYEKK